jgi:hypothetical protein
MERERVNVGVQLSIIDMMILALRLYQSMTTVA